MQGRINTARTKLESADIPIEDRIQRQRHLDRMGTQLTQLESESPPEMEGVLPEPPKFMGLDPSSSAPTTFSAGRLAAPVPPADRLLLSIVRLDENIAREDARRAEIAKQIRVARLIMHPTSAQPRVAAAREPAARRIVELQNEDAAIAVRVNRLSDILASWEQRATSAPPDQLFLTDEEAQQARATEEVQAEAARAAAEEAERAQRRIDFKHGAQEATEEAERAQRRIDSMHTGG